MMRKEAHRIGKDILKCLPEFSIARDFIFLPPAKTVLRGILLDGSGFDKTSLSVSTFLLPLCVPTRHLYLNFGTRIRRPGGGDRWNVKEPGFLTELAMALETQAVPLLSRVTSLGDFIEIAETISTANPHTRRAIAYALARLGRWSEALDVIDKMLGQVDPAVPWQRALADEAKLLKARVNVSPPQALRQLEIWARETEINLGLDALGG